MSMTTYSVPPGRGRWRLTLHHRQYADAAWMSTLITEFPEARSVHLEQNLNKSAQLTFQLDGRSEAAAQILELQQDVIAWRWDEISGTDIPYFRGIIGQAEDELDESLHIVTITCHDYFEMLSRRSLTSALNYTASSQDTIISDLLTRSRAVSSSSGTSFVPGSYLPLYPWNVNPDGTGRGITGTVRQRNYPPGIHVDTAIDDLSKCIGGFDYDVVPAWRILPGSSSARQFDWLRVFYPNQGVARTGVLEYGGALSTVKRTVASSDYANYDRIIGNNGSSDVNAPQFYSESWNPDSNNITAVPIGLWMNDENAADVNIQATLNERAQGTVNFMGVLVPSYELGLKPGTYSEGLFNIGDTVPVVIKSGRLNVNAPQRIVGLTFDQSDTGAEDVTITVGRSLSTLANLLTKADEDVNALTRR